jgi:DNA (cytosine-5)-methyltransferase 1
MKVIDLFCGCGGFSQGFEKAGFTVLGVDIWDVSLQSHGGNTLLFDITNLKQHHIPKEFQNPDIIIGSPPCQQFSTANRNRTKDDTLICHFERIVSELHPRFWVWENVLGSKSRTVGTILDAQDFGVAQRRKRNFVSNVALNNLKKSKKVTVREVLKGSIKGSGLLDGFNSKIYPLDDVSPTIRRIPLKWYDGRYDSVGMPNPLRFTGFDMLTIQQHLVLMGFDKDFKLHGSKTQQMLQIGNAVSPIVSYAIAQEIRRLCI